MIPKKLSILNLSNLLAILGLGCLWCITRLPYRWQIQVGRLIGKIIYVSSSGLRHVTEINVTLCFPELTTAQRKTLIKKNFESLGIGVIETAMAWWLSDNRLKQCEVTLTGMEHAEKAFAKGHGIILLGPHFTCLEMIGRLLGNQYEFAVMYRPHKNRFLSAVQARFRKKYRIKQIARHRMREVLRTLQSNTAIWYAYDVDGGLKRSVFAPFFGVPTASLTAVSRITKMSNATIIPIHFYRLEDRFGYQINLLPPIENLPSDDPVGDATRLNASLEKGIRAKPEQYIWQYKRFKTRPLGEKRYY
jgi:KDO2-lipid IV(A) lauroyltransferase